MKTEALVSMKFSSAKKLRIFLDALLPETHHPIGNQVKVKIVNEDAILHLKVDAKDTTALRSTLNAYLRWTLSIESVTEFLNGHS